MFNLLYLTNGLSEHQARSNTSKRKRFGLGATGFKPLPITPIGYLVYVSKSKCNEFKKLFLPRKPRERKSVTLFNHFHLESPSRPFVIALDEARTHFIILLKGSYFFVCEGKNLNI